MEEIHSYADLKDKVNLRFKYGIPSIIFFLDYAYNFNLIFEKFNYYEKKFFDLSNQNNEISIVLKMYANLEAEIEKFLETVFTAGPNVYDQGEIAASIGVLFINFSNCSRSEECLKLKTALMNPADKSGGLYHNSLLSCFGMNGCSSLPLNIPEENSGYALKAETIIDSVYDHFYQSTMETDQKNQPVINFNRDEILMKERLKHFEIKYNSVRIQPISDLSRDFDARDYKNVVIIYTANYCVHCHDMAKKFEHVAKVLEKSYTFLHLKSDIKSEDFAYKSLGEDVNDCMTRLPDQQSKLNQKNFRLLTETLKLKFEGFPSFFIFNNFGQRTKANTEQINLWEKESHEIISVLRNLAQQSTKVQNNLKLGGSGHWTLRRRK